MSHTDETKPTLPYFVHPTAEVSAQAHIGAGTRIWRQAHIREHADIVGHALDWRDEVPPTIEGDRRGSSSTAPEHPGRTTNAFSQMFVRLRRTIDRA